MDQYPNIFHLVIPSCDGCSVLADMRGEAPRLPHVAPPKTEDSLWVNSWNGETDDLCTVIAHLLRSPVYVRRPLWLRPDPPPGCEEVVLVVELMLSENNRDSTNASDLPSGFEWLSRKTALEAKWPPLYEQLDTVEMLSEFFEETLDTGVPSNRAPWRRAAWFLDTIAWVKSVLREHDLEPSTELQQVRNMFQSSVLRCKVRISPSAPSKSAHRARNTNGFVYVKTTVPVSPEAAVTSTVSSLMPGFVPKVLATDKDNISFVQLGAWPGDDIEPSVVMDALAKLHIQSLQCIEGLKSGGVPDRSLTWLSENITTILEDAALRLFRHNQHLVELQSRVGEIKHLCETLMSLKIPHTLVHGDFNTSNVCEGVEPGTKVSFIDWESCCIAYPLYDYARVTRIGYEVIDDEVAQDLYLNHWRRFESRGNILKAIALSYPLMLCDNLFWLLRMYGTVESIEKGPILDAIKARLKGILDALNETASGGSPSNTYHFIICNQTGDGILASRSDGQVSLPVLSPPRAISSIRVNKWDENPHRLRILLKNNMGCDCWVVRPVWIRPDTAYGVEEAVLVVELLDKCLDRPEGLEWVHRTGISLVKWKAIHELIEPVDLVQTFFDEAAGLSKRQHRPPWRVGGWFQDMVQWVEAALRKKGLSIVEPIRQERTTFQSTVLVCTVRRMKVKGAVKMLEGSDIVYVKATQPNFPEAKLSSEICSFSCSAVPKIIEISETRNMYIQEDAGVLDERDFDQAKLIKTLAELQIRSISHLNALKGCGMNVFNAEWLMSHAASVLLNPVLDSCNGVVGLRSRIAEIESYARELVAFNIPETLVHGDFHLGNVGRRCREDGYHIFDWGSCFVGNPFCDFAVLSRMPQNPEIDLEAVEDSYLAFWGNCGTQSELRRAVQLAFVSYWVINLHALLRFHGTIEVVEEVYILKMLDETVSHLTIAMDEASLDNSLKRKYKEAVAGSV